MLKLKFPIYFFGTFYSSLKNAIIKKNSTFTVYFSSFNLLLSYFLFKKRYFSNIMIFNLLNRSFIHITLNYHEECSSIVNILSFYSKKNIKTVTVSKLRDLSRLERSSFILSTSRGIFNTSDAIINNVGGVILFEIY
ncbi:ribosomal protein S8 (mitochondrion) [Naegleria fowleri]|uniref:Ribosomal protein S8 n=1 Tax=Naegleria fowleri TaxID=5763 RepID=M4H5R7_NAEFO|nr:ribosomal protein S8 [Naegleria fowleri]AFP72321.1 ribosomal protein S8 [Naegleria fowleri]AOS85638.1 ribosomal protein S8 [Naegleria fowleri]AOS85684.1 ribosomal protein S8 [Naegleria fowleri]UAT97089.1 ribosomal protein S8 [Naegleria fowleri]WND64459.1 hypothetical protein HHPHBPLO_00039 [Naegleria fowleri]